MTFGIGSSSTEDYSWVVANEEWTMIGSTNHIERSNQNMLKMIIFLYLFFTEKSCFALNLATLRTADKYVNVHSAYNRY